MSRLFFTEEGRVIPTLCEEVTSIRWARKELTLPATHHSATLYVLARARMGVTAPLHVVVNGQRVTSIASDGAGVYRWYALTLPSTLVQSGVNRFEFFTDGSSMTTWSIALEAGAAQPQSAVSDDGGETWRYERMGYLCAVRGEYVVRVQLAEGNDSEPPRVVWEKTTHPRVLALKKRLPEAVHRATSRMEQVRILSTWLSSSWEHTSSGRAAQYAPWDAETIVDWGGSQQGHNGQRPIAMCVHYAVVLTSACQAIGIPARCAAVTGGINTGDGHFVSEVWFDEWQKWVMVDANADAIFYTGDVPMSIDDIQKGGSDIGGMIRWGEGAAFQRQFPHMVDFITNKLETGLCFKYRSLWARADLLSHPEFSPPGHGSTSYCETGFVWDVTKRHDLGMFPYFGDWDYFNTPPE